MAQDHCTTIDVEVRYQETDAMGVVHHANYLVWFELARTRWCRDLGLPYPQVEAAGYYLIVSGVELRYLRPARYGDQVSVSCRMARMASRLLRFAYEVSRDGELLVTGHSEHVWLDRETRRPVRMPSMARAAFGGPSLPVTESDIAP